MISVFRRMLSRHAVSDEDLSTLADGRPTPPREAAVLAHVEVCEPCRHKLAELRALKALLAAVPQAAPRRSFALGAEHQRRPSVAPKASSRLVFAPAAALSALLLLLAADFALIDNGAGRATDGAASLAADKAASEAAPAAPQPAAAGRAASDSPAEPSPSA
ncbi:MAG TPA: zf-HC2 domain-containing protein, partial [Dehalococcoidia bacterium]|nr:zf-HC2 domain-containing protein [Dehalococcoidia bacterium]